VLAYVDDDDDDDEKNERVRMTESRQICSNHIPEELYVPYFKAAIVVLRLLRLLRLVVASLSPATDDSRWCIAVALLSFGTTWERTDEDHWSS
jgi:hypothetical protein